MVIGIGLGKIISWYVVILRYYLLQDWLLFVPVRCLLISVGDAQYGLLIEGLAKYL